MVDSLAPTIRKAFNGSKIAKSYASGRKKTTCIVKGGGWCHRNGKRVKVNLLSRNENNGSGILIFDNEWTIAFWETPHFLGKKPFVLLFAFLFVDLEFSFPSLTYFIYFKRRSFRSEIVAKVYAGEKAHFPSFTKIFFYLQSFYV